MLRRPARLVSPRGAYAIFRNPSQVRSGRRKEDSLFSWRLSALTIPGSHEPMRENKDIYSEFNVFQDEATVEGTLHIVPQIERRMRGHRTVLPVPYNNNPKHVCTTLVTPVAHDLCR